MIKFQRFISRDEVQALPQKRFVFGDNLHRVGLGGQARAMRGEPNAIGVATKRSPHMDSAAFFKDRPEEIYAVCLDLKKIDDALREGRTIIVPSDGLGTGLAELPQRSPMIHEVIRAFIGARVQGNLPW